ncbi:MAG: class I SAM-dependent methyltransferase [Chloroflexota bacterium]
MYEAIARYYDLIHADLTADIDFVLALAAGAAGPVLELGCGTGRLLLPLAHSGHKVTGVDNSPAMLALAQKRLAVEPATTRERVTLIEADFTRFSETARLNGPFGLALFGHNTIMHLEPTSVTAVLPTVGRLLAPLGLLLIDVMNPLLVAQTPNDGYLSLEATRREPVTGDWIVQMAGSWLDDVKQILHVTWLFDRSPAAAGPIQRTIAEMDYHYLYPHEWTIILEAAGFQLVTLYGDYHNNPFDEQSERLLLVARPPSP